MGRVELLCGKKSVWLVLGVSFVLSGVVFGLGCIVWAGCNVMRVVSAFLEGVAS